MSVVTEVHRHFVCPSCNQAFESRYDQFDNWNETRGAGPWYCRTCGLCAEHIRYNPQTQEIAVTFNQEKSWTPILMLLRVAQSEAEDAVDVPVYFVLRDIRHIDKGLEAAKEHAEYFVDEHTCPTNLFLGCGLEAIIEGDNTDPHGVLEFVDLVVIPADFDSDNYTIQDWRLLFPALSKEIDGTTVDIILKQLR